MKYQILTLRQLMEELSEHELNEIINRFKSISQQDGKSNDVEYFLHNKAIHLEKVIFYNGMNLSQGKRQKILLSRALNKRQCQEFCVNSTSCQSSYQSNNVFFS